MARGCWKQEETEATEFSGSSVITVCSSLKGPRQSLEPAPVSNDEHAKDAESQAASGPCRSMVNVGIMRAFVSLRRMLAANELLARKLTELERRLEGHDQAIRS
jgi:hypothetical protein